MGSFESESRLEERMIDQLRKQGYQYVEINDVTELERNFREQVNLHNRGELKFKDLSDKEFERLMVKISGKGVFQSAKELRQKQDIQRDDGSIAYLELFNTKDWCKNTFQVTHQTTVEGKYVNRYDVTILINGISAKLLVSMTTNSISLLPTVRLINIMYLLHRMFTLILKLRFPVLTCC